MSRRTYCEVVPFKVECSLEEDLLIHEDSFDEDLSGGWKMFMFAGDYGDLIVSGATKADLKVYAVNESQYSNIGKIEGCYFSDDEKSLIEFCKDHGIQANIKRNAKVYQII